MNNRRKLIVAFGAGALAAPFASFAQQQGKIFRIGFVFARTQKDNLEMGRGDQFLQGMREVGLMEGKDFVVDWRYADGKMERLAGIMAELVRANVDLIVTTGTQVSFAAKKATTTIPIVITAEANPVGNGFAASLAHPGGNITGLSTSTADLVGKHLELIKEMVPAMSRVAVLRNPSNKGHAAMVANIQTAARSIGVQVLTIEAGTADDIQRGFATMKRERADALICLIDAVYAQQRRQIANLAIELRLPSIYAQVEHAAAGGLMVYGQDQSENYRRVGIFIDKIRKGAKPGDLPFEQPTKFTTVVNLKTAKALGIKIPNSILVRADKVIE